jgi:hypothetical protein
MAVNLANALENLSAYKHPFDIHDSRAIDNPVNYRHIKVRVGGVAYHILSRIADLRHEHTGRTNKLAHHVVLPAANLPIAGPAKVLSYPGVCRTQWDGKVGLVPEISPSRLPRSDTPSSPCRAWKAVAGDAAWAAYVADQLIQSPNDPLSIIFPLGLDTLPLVEEVLNLLPPPTRWNVTFSTYFTTLPPGTTCAMRWLLHGTPEADQIRRDYRRKVLDLTTKLGPPPESELAAQARQGRPSSTTPPPVPQPAVASQQRRAAQPAAEPSLSAIEMELGPPEINDEDFSFRLPNDSPATRLRKPIGKRSKAKSSLGTHPALLAGVGATIVCVLVFVIFSLTRPEAKPEQNPSRGGGTTERTTANETSAAEAVATPVGDTVVAASAESSEAVSSTGSSDESSSALQAASLAHDVPSATANDGQDSDDAQRAVSTATEPETSAGAIENPELVIESFVLPSISRASSEVVQSPVVLASNVAFASQGDIRIIGLDQLMIEGNSHLGFVVEREDADGRPTWVVRELRLNQFRQEVFTDVARIGIEDRKLIFQWGSDALGNASLVDGLRWCVLEVPAITGKSNYIPLTLPGASRRVFQVQRNSMRRATGGQSAQQTFRMALKGDVLPRTEHLSVAIAIKPYDDQSCDWECQLGPESNACIVKMRTSSAPDANTPMEQLVVRWSSQFVADKGGGPRTLQIDVTCELKESQGSKSPLAKALQQWPFTLLVSLIADYDDPKAEGIPQVHIADGIELKPSCVEAWQ